MSAPTSFDYQPFFDSQRNVVGRAVVERARGMIMLRYHIDAEQAFEVLRLWARKNGTSVAEAAHTLVQALLEGDSDPRSGARPPG